MLIEVFAIEIYSYIFSGNKAEYVNISLHFKHKFGRRFISLQNCNFKAKTNNDKKNVSQKPILEVISPGKLKESSKQSEVLLDNIKEKSLDDPDGQPSILSSESIKKLKEKIIGKTESDELKG